jgi:hypothetical protein
MRKINAENTCSKINGKYVEINENFIPLRVLFALTVYKVQIPSRESSFPRTEPLRVSDMVPNNLLKMSVECGAPLGYHHLFKQL